jgi:hypothetical protein
LLLVLATGTQAKDILFKFPETLPFLIIFVNDDNAFHQAGERQQNVNEDEEADGKRFEAKMPANHDAKGLDPKLPSRSKSESNDTNAPTRESPESSGPSMHPKNSDASSTSQIPNITLV